MGNRCEGSACYKFIGLKPKVLLGHITVELVAAENENAIARWAVEHDKTVTFCSRPINFLPNIYIYIKSIFLEKQN